MNSKRPIQTTSHLQNDPGPDRKHAPWPTLITKFWRGERTLMIALLLYGVLSLVTGMLCAMSLPGFGLSPAGALTLSGIAFAWFGYKLWFWLALTRRTINEAAFYGEYTARIQAFIRTLRGFRPVLITVLVLGICGIVLSCVVERMAQGVSLWLILALQSGILSALMLMMTFRLEVHLNEIRKDSR